MNPLEDEESQELQPTAEVEKNKAIFNRIDKIFKRLTPGFKTYYNPENAAYPTALHFNDERSKMSFTLFAHHDMGIVEFGGMDTAGRGREAVLYEVLPFGPLHQSSISDRESTPYGILPDDQETRQMLSLNDFDYERIGSILDAIDDGEIVFTHVQT